MTTKNFAVSLTNCFFCGGPGTLLMNTRLTPRDAANVESAHHKVIDMTPCNKCSEFMKEGIILLTIDTSKSKPGWNKPDGSDHWMPNPYRAGGFIVVREQWAISIPEELSKFALKNRWMFIEHETAIKLGMLNDLSQHQHPQN